MSQKQILMERTDFCIASLNLKCLTVLLTKMEKTSDLLGKKKQDLLLIDKLQWHRGTAFLQEGGEVKITAFKNTLTSALSSGKQVYLALKSGEEAEFEEGITYVIKN